MGLLPMDLDILPPSDDRVFKLILTSPHAKPVLTDLISSLIRRPVTDVVVQYANIPAQRETVNKIIESKEALQMAGDLLMSISQDEKERAVFRSRRMFQTDMESNMATAEDRGRREGRAETARNLKLLGVSMDLIIKSTGLSQEEIAKLN